LEQWTETLEWVHGAVVGKNGSQARGEMSMGMGMGGMGMGMGMAAEAFGMRDDRW
jgi:COP9 signalosome complex subunit 2